MCVRNQLIYWVMSILYPIPILRTGSRGNVSVTSSLVGAPELERYFPDHQLKIWVGSWNMGDIKVSELY